MQTLQFSSVCVLKTSLYRVDLDEKGVNVRICVAVGSIYM